MRKEAAGSLAYSLTWEPPASPNGILRFYKVCTTMCGRSGGGQVLYVCSECDREEGLGDMSSCGVSPVLVCQAGLL